MNIDDLKQNISELPTGGITVKKIKNKESGKVYEYQVYQWRENGKQKSRYLKEGEAELLSSLIDERKTLEQELAIMETADSTNQDTYMSRMGSANRAERTDQASNDCQSEYFTDIQAGEALRRLTISVRGFRKRPIIEQLENYIYGNEYNRVFILYGLRRTGKTTIIKQIISEMPEDIFERTAFIQIKASDNLGQLNRDLKQLSAGGYRYIFLDEVTLMPDFIEGAAVLSDIYAASGVKIVLSGTDSLGFRIAESNELYDRCYLLHTTFISYSEFENVLGIKGIDEYIEYGGTMSISGNRYNAFSDIAAADEYVDSAIARNIQHSLRYYQDEGHFRHLYSLYEKGELTGAINRIVEDINHRFTVDVLTREFKSGDLSISARNLRADNNVLDLIDREAVTDKLKELLEIKNKSEQSVVIDEIHVKEIREYLKALDLIKEISIADIDNYGNYDSRTAFIQAGIRYSQAKALVETLMKDAVFAALSFQDRKYVENRILNEIKGRMLEDIVILETSAARPDREVFKLQFADGEYDMLVFDNRNGGCSIYEIKYSTVVDDKQVRHLINEQKLRKTEFRYGNIEGRYVLYRGETKLVDGIQYVNVEEYLNSLWNNNRKSRENYN